MVDAVKGVERVRYMTSHPKDLSDAVIDAVRQGRHICPHFHLPVQHGSDRILQAMNRVYRKDAYRSLVERIRAAVPDASLTTDLIVGFPGETEEDFQQTLKIVKEVEYDSAFMFMYSKRSGTPAATMEEQVDEQVKNERLQQLMRLQNYKAKEESQKYLGKTVKVLVEGPSRKNPEMLTGRTSTHKIVLFKSSRTDLKGKFVNIKIYEAKTWTLYGELEE